MRRAIAAAWSAGVAGDRPHGALAAWGGEVIVEHDRTSSSADPMAHAIALVVGAAARRRGSWRLDGVEIVTTHEPCVMCAGALVAARVERLVFGADLEDGAAGSRYNVLSDPRLGHEVVITPGVLAGECGALG